MQVSALIETGKQLVSGVLKDAIVKANDKSYILFFKGIEKEPVKKDADGNGANKNQLEKKNRFKMIVIVKGVEESGYQEIKFVEELKPKTNIVTKGAFYIYPGMQSVETDNIQKVILVLLPLPIKYLKLLAHGVRQQ